MPVGAYIKCGGQDLPDKYHLQYVDITSSVNKVPIAELGLKDGNTSKKEFPLSDTTLFEPGSELEVALFYHGGSARFDKSKAVTVFKGIVTRHTLSATRSSVQLIVEARHEVVKMTTDRKNAVFIKKKQTDKEIISDVFKSAKVKGLKFQGKASFSPQEEMIQYYSTDWDFVLTRADANGLLVIPHTKGVTITPFDDSATHKEEFELNQDNIIDFDFEVTNDSQYATVNGNGWNPKEQKVVTAAKPAKAEKGKLGNLDPAAISKDTGGKAYTLNATIATKKELAGWAEGIQTKAKLAMLKGRVSIRGTTKVEVGQVIKFKDMGKRFTGKTMVTGIRHRANIRSWRTDIQFGGSGEWHAHKEEVMEQPASGLLPGINGLQIGVVQEFIKDKSGLTRAKVLVPGLKTKKSKGLVWARLATPYAGKPDGKPRGMLFWPEKGDEVVLGFFNDDPRHAVILGSMFSKTNELPAKVDKKNALKAIVSKKDLKLQFDDVKEVLSLETKEFSFMIDQKKGAMTMEDKKSANKVILDNKGITLKADQKDITLKSKGKLLIDAQAVEITASKVETK